MLIVTNFYVSIWRAWTNKTATLNLKDSLFLVFLFSFVSLCCFVILRLFCLTPDPLILNNVDESVTGPFFITLFYD